jgi:hypothetical protein
MRILSKKKEFLPCNRNNIQTELKKKTSKKKSDRNKEVTFGGVNLVGGNILSSQKPRRRM